jgi:hypothetical protein
LCIVVIYDRWSHSDLRYDGGPSFFFLQDVVPMRRIFSDLDKGSTTDVAQSGLFLGGTAGTRALRSHRCGGEDKGADCVSTLLPNIFLVKVLALSYIPLSLRDFVVNLYPPLD